MTLSTLTLLRVAVTTLGIVGLGAMSLPASADQYSASTNPCGTVLPHPLCARIIFKPAFVVKNVHPLVGSVIVWCATKIGEPDVWATAESLPPHRLYHRDVSFTPVGSYNPPTISILKSALTPGRVFTVTCELMLTGPDAQNSASERRLAVASAATPQPITATNWHIVAAGSVVKWTQNVTFPSSAQMLEATPRRGAATP
jgi:hypothetical protein